MKTQEEIEELKRQWKLDPCWDIEATDGFEDHYDELVAFHQAYDRERDEAYIKRTTPAWEAVLTDMYTYTYRMKVFGGWIVKSSECSGETSMAVSMVFVPDPNHKWRITPANMQVCFDCGQNVNLLSHKCESKPV